MPFPTYGRRLLAAFACAFALCALSASLAWAAPPLPFGHACGAKEDVLFCPTVTLDQRVPSFDRSPIDVDVTLPGTGDGPFPTIVLLHGYGGKKEDAQGTGRFEDVDLARRGYAAVTLSNRGFGLSCGAASSRTPDCSTAGWIHLADQRFEVRDTQELLGRLVDEGIAKPDALGAAGGSYGGGQSLQLAYLKNRVRMPDGSLVPWTSPKGVPLSIAAAAPLVPWADLAAALVPNGRWHDDERYRQQIEVQPVGVPIKSYINGLYLAGDATGWVAPIGSDPQADLAGWKKLFIEDGEPYGADARAIGEQMQEFHSAMGIATGKPAPLLVANGWTDDLFPAPHALRAYNETRARGGDSAPISILLGAFGHDRGGKEPAIQSEIADQRDAFFDFWLKDEGKVPTPGQATVALTMCPNGKRSKIYKARTYGMLARRAVVFGDLDAQTVKSTGGDPALGKQFDPLGAGGPCGEATAKKSRGSAYVEGSVDETTVTIGRTEVTGRVVVSGSDAQLAARLWDVDPKTKKMRLADRGILRLRPGQRGAIRFQLNGNGWQWKRGHVMRLELSGSDADYYRPSDKPFSVKVTKLNASLHVR